MSETQVVKTICRMCGTLCGINAHIRDGKLVRVEGDCNNILNKGRICIKGSSAATWLNLPTRLMKPLRRNGSVFEEIDLERAMDEIAEKLLRIQKEYGDAAIGVWKGEGIDFAQQEELARRFIHAVGSPNYFSNDTQCFASRYLSFNLVYGCWPQADYENSKLVLNWGTNAPVSHTFWMQQINEGREKGGKLVVIDTRYTEIARQADLFIQPRPGTDAALAWGVIREMVARDEIDHHFVENFTVGFDKVKAYAEAFTYDRVEEVTGVDGETIRRLSDMIAAARPQVSSWPGTGLEHQANGVNSIRAMTIIDALAGAIDRKGGMLTPSGMGQRSLTLYDEKPLPHLEPIGKEKFPVVYAKRGECHTLTLMDQILSGEPYPFKGLVMTAANPVLTNANTGKAIEALKSLELLVVKDLFPTETTQLAHYILPAASFLEREELFCNSAKQAAFITGKYLDYGLQTEYELFKGLADRMGAGEFFPWKDDHEVTEWLLEPTGFTVEDLKKSPSGFLYGKYEYEKHVKKQSQGKPPFPTASGKAEFFSQYLEDLGMDGLPVYRAPAYLEAYDSAYPYILMTGARKQKYFHGRYRNIPQLRDAEPHGSLEMHPDDAARIGVKTGDRVRVRSRVGHFETYALVMHAKEIYPGSMQCSHGFADENVNWATYDDVCDPISGFPALKSVSVAVQKL